MLCRCFLTVHLSRFLKSSTFFVSVFPSHLCVDDLAEYDLKNYGSRSASTVDNTVRGLWVFNLRREKFYPKPASRNKTLQPFFRKLTKLFIRLVPVPQAGVRLALTNNKEVQFHRVSSLSIILPVIRKPNQIVFFIIYSK